MDTFYLAIDIGASSGRHILLHPEDGKMVTEEIYRFDNLMTETVNGKCWDLEKLFANIKAGLKKCKEIGKIPVSVGIDTWGVDYVLLDEHDEIIGPTYAYRNDRTAGMDLKVSELISEEELYQRTGIQKQPFNSVYQLMAMKCQEKELLDRARTFLMLPDYFHFLLTGVKSSEYTNATTSQLVNATTGDWDHALIEKLGFPKDMFLPLQMPGTCVGDMKEEMVKEIGFSCKVIRPATHDTASAVMAVPTVSEDALYISSGTWSLMGVESKTPFCDEKARALNLTNEGGYDHRFRVIKNIMGLWMIQSVRHELNDEYSFAALCDLAEAKKDFPSRVDVNDNAFLAPKSMIEAIKDYCKKTAQSVPKTPGELASVIYLSLAESYADALAAIEQLTGRQYNEIHVVGGGSNAAYLNRLTAKRTGKKVLAGPSEATAIGNLMAQMLFDKQFKDLKEARACVYESFGIEVYEA